MWGRRSSLGRALLAIALLACGFVVSVPQPARAQAVPPPEAFVVVDAGSGAVLTSRNLHEALPPASIGKIMTALVAVERLPADAKIEVSENAAIREASRIGMNAGERWPFDQAMASMMMVSANDAAYAIAETAGGSIPGFAAMLNESAQRYGMQDSTFSDPAGLTDGTSYLGGPKVSAYDMAIATRNALAVPEIAQWAALRSFQFTDVNGAPHDLTNHNRMLDGGEYAYPGTNGFKTGYTQIASHSLVATANRDGRQLIVVLLGSVDSGWAWATSLLDQGFAMPKNSEGTGITLPEVAVSPYGTRVAQREGFVQLARGNNAAVPLATPTTEATAEETAAAPAAQSSGDGGGLFSMTRIVLVLVVALVVAFVLRRRAVKRQRARRIARQRARAKAMRSGSLPVVDGRYRTGTRVGPPVESQVRVQRGYIDLTKDEPRRSPARGSARRRTP